MKGWECFVRYILVSNWFRYLHVYWYSENDRKANIEVLEANKTANKDEIKKLRDDNKDLRQKYAQLQKVFAFFLLNSVN